jgi:transposase
MIRDTPMHGRRVAVYVQARRFRCRDCGKTITERLPDVAEGQRMTQRLYTWICRKSLEKTHTSVALDVGISEGTVRQIFNVHIDQMAKQYHFVTPEWMGIDEIHILGQPRCVISNIETNTIVDMLEGRTKQLVINYFMRLPDRHSIKCVAMDMWEPYKDAVRACMPGADIVVDKFHVLRMANACLDTVRKSIGNSLTPAQRRGLMRSRHLLMKREGNLVEKDMILFSTWMKNFPLLKEAYDAKEDFYRIYDCMTINEAEGAYLEWFKGLSETTRTAYKPLITAVTNWFIEIMMYFEHPVTNAFTESINNLIRFTNRSGRGYSFKALRAKVLFTNGAHKLVYPKFERKNEWSYSTLSTMIQPKPHNFGTDISTLLKLQDQDKTE